MAFFEASSKEDALPISELVVGETDGTFTLVVFKITLASAKLVVGETDGTFTLVVFKITLSSAKLVAEDNGSTRVVFKITMAMRKKTAVAMKGLHIRTGDCWSRVSCRIVGDTMVE